MKMKMLSKEDALGYAAPIAGGLVNWKFSHFFDETLLKKGFGASFSLWPVFSTALTIVLILLAKESKNKNISGFAMGSAVASALILLRKLTYNEKLGKSSLVPTSFQDAKITVQDMVTAKLQIPEPPEEKSISGIIEIPYSGIIKRENTLNGIIETNSMAGIIETDIGYNNSAMSGIIQTEQNFG